MNIDKQKIEMEPPKNTKHTQIPLRLVTEQKKKKKMIALIKLIQKI